MKRILRILGAGLGVAVLLIGGFAAFIAIKGIPTFDVTIPAEIAALQVPRDSAYVERGAKIATLLCNECHRGADGRLVGAFLADVPAEFGKLTSYNITHDSVHGIGSWTDGELYYFLRTGLRKDGTWAPPYMPKFPLMADEDVFSIIAWLRSDDPTLAPDPRENPPNKPNFLVKFLSNVVFKPIPLPKQPIRIPDTTDVVALGRYVANGVCGCYGCHSADFKTMNDLEPEKSGGFYGGGNPLLNKERELVPSANITMDKETGIGNWTQQQFYEAVKFGKNPKGGPLYYPMFPHTTLSDTETNAIWAYLQTVPTLKNAVVRYQPKN
ncbi:MAG: hypothetical protein JNK89_07060 [Saprospiraceae bacterium]|nr:hypothetical protein [Saprospiraceae bacterium]